MIEGCQEVYALERAQEWTAALAKWCEQQPEMIAFTGVCRVHRAEILQLRGAWSEALAEARCALDRSLEVNQQAAAAAFYQLAELQRLRGDFRAAEAAYESASQAGLEPQPGLALLRLAQRRVDAAAAAMRRVIASSSECSRRARLLPAYVEIMLACGDMESARSACGELELIAARLSGSALRAAAAHARGAVELAEGDARGPRARSGVPGNSGKTSTRRTWPHARVCWWGSAVARWGTRRAPGSSSPARERSLLALAPRRTSLGSTSSLHAAQSTPSSWVDTA